MARVRVKVPVDESVAEATVLSEQPELAPSIEAYQKPLTKKRLVIAGCLVVIFLVALLVVSLISDRKHLKEQVNKLSASQSSATPSDAQKYQADVEKIIDVPKGITPVAKTLTGAEVSQLSKDNPIYKSAEDGDVFFLYTYPDKSLFLVIYRPATQKVVLATLGSQQAAQTPAKQ